MKHPVHNYDCADCAHMLVNAVSTTARSVSLTCPDVTEDDGETPLDTAIDRDYTEVVNYLKSVQKPSTLEPGMCH